MARNDGWEQEQFMRVIVGARLDEILVEPLRERLRRSIEAVLLDTRENALEEAAQIVESSHGMRDTEQARAKLVAQAIRNRAKNGSACND